MIDPLRIVLLFKNSRAASSIAAADVSVASCSTAADPTVVLWQKPQLGRYKCNINASFSPQRNCV